MEAGAARECEIFMEKMNKTNSSRTEMTVYTVYHIYSSAWEKLCNVYNKKTLQISCGMLLLVFFFTELCLLYFYSIQVLKFMELLCNNSCTFKVSSFIIITIRPTYQYHWIWIYILLLYIPSIKNIGLYMIDRCISVG